MKLTVLSVFVFGASVLTPAAFAQHEEHGSHTHGQATLTFVLEGNEAELAFATATANIVGFEHLAGNDTERQLVQKMMADFTNASWFSFSKDANCTVTETDISSDLTAERSSAPTHADLNANYRLLCQNPALLQQLTLDLSAVAAGVEKVSVQWILNGEQGAADWTPSAAAVPLLAQ